MQKRVFTILYFIVLLIDLTAIACNIKVICYIADPLLSIILAVYFFSNTKSVAWSFRLLMTLALLFSFIGDIFLLFEEKEEIFFIIGIACFLITHLSYIGFFLKIRYSNLPLPDCKWPFIFLTEAALLLFIFSMLPYLGDMSIPVIIYAIFISFTLLTSIHAFRLKEQSIGWFCISGAILFIASDTLEAIDHFYHTVPAGNFFITLTYALAQWGLCAGGLWYLQVNHGPDARGVRTN
jgi:uncharacterized membrane protein YhhN